MTNEPRKLSTEPYKGVRDFYPEDQQAQNHIFDTWRKAVGKFGYVEYSASILEPAELYREKSGEELVNEQTYSFTDRGGREVTLRPEMTPSVARMVAAKRKELGFPLRWFSMPNLFRYERPQKGRLREHWQLNVDIFGVPTLDAEVEIISVAHGIMREFGAGERDFTIKLNSRKLVNAYFSAFGISGDEAYAASKLIDRRRKMPAAEFEAGLAPYLGERASDFIAMLDDSTRLKGILGESAELRELEDLIGRLAASGVPNVEFDASLMRGLDYYTGIVFEIFDSNPDNPRSMFGGGRYDRLLEIFDAEPVHAVGFGMGDVTLREFLESRGLLPAFKSPIDASIIVVDDESRRHAEGLAQDLRSRGLNIALDLSHRKVADQLRKAERDGIRHVVFVGKDEMSAQKYKVKDLSAHEEAELAAADIAGHIARRA